MVRFISGWVCKRSAAWLEIMIDRGLIADQAHALAANQIEFPGQQPFDTELDWLSLHQFFSRREPSRR